MKIKLSSKMHLFIIISSVLVALGLAVGIICQFAAGGFFNYNQDLASEKTVTVSYEYVDFSSEEEVEKICKDAFKSAGVKNYAVTVGDTSTGGIIVYKMPYSADLGKIEKAVAAIETAIQSSTEVDGDVRLSYASYGNAVNIFEGNKEITRAIIIAVVSLVFAFAYFAIRYKLSIGLGASLACVHNFALYIALLALVRIPVDSSIVVFGVLTVIFTIVGCAVYFDRVRKNCKDEELKKLSAYELTDQSAAESFKLNIFIFASLAALAVLLFVLMSISSLSPLAVISPILCALISFIVCAYGTTMFIPSVYSRFKLLGENFKNNRIRAKSAKKAGK